MDTTLTTALEDTIKDCLNKAKHAAHATDAMHYTQAALNATNALISIRNSEKSK